MTYTYSYADIKSGVGELIVSNYVAVSINN